MGCANSLAELSRGVKYADVALGALLTSSISRLWPRKEHVEPKDKTANSEKFNIKFDCQCAEYSNL